MTAVYLNKTRKKRLEQGHPWIYGNEIERLEGQPEPGQLVRVLDHRGRFLAAGYYNALSQITVRVVSYNEMEQTALDEAFFVKKITACWRYRQRFLADHAACRVVYGEADFLPGLIVDKYNDVLVVQIVSLGMDLRREAIVAALVAVFQPQGIYERSDVGVRELEGLEQRTGILYGQCPSPLIIQENGLQLEVDIVHGQKTGYFFDQRDNRAAIGALMRGWGYRSGIALQRYDKGGEQQLLPTNSKGKEVTFPYWDGATVLECFSHTGSFTLNACKHGAKKVTCLDISEHAIATAKRNIALNDFTERVEFVVADAFDYLRAQVKGSEERLARSLGQTDTSKPLTAEARTWDVIILDPPAFAKTKSAVAGACRGYKDINLHALKLINEGGFLVTASCSYHIYPELFLETVQSAALDAGKILRLVTFSGAGKDHPQIAGAEESDYLKFAIFEVHTRS